MGGSPLRWCINVREYKFRGKRKDNGEWVYGVPVETSISGVYMVSSKAQTKGGRGGVVIRDVVVQHEVDPATVGQYTGLKDKHWREIYEGDILRYLKVAGHTSTGIVKYITEFARWEYWHTQQNEGFPVLSDCDNMDVIGNIHDNPELLEVNKP